jgi:hypothetical protein
LLLLLNDPLAGFLHHSGEGFQDGVTISLETIGYLNELIRAAGQFVTESGSVERSAASRHRAASLWRCSLLSGHRALQTPDRDIPNWQIRTVCESN